jgi:hypothetical protein
MFNLDRPGTSCSSHLWIRLRGLLGLGLDCISGCAPKRVSFPSKGKSLISPSYFAVAFDLLRHLTTGRDGAGRFRSDRNHRARLGWARATNRKPHNRMNGKARTTNATSSFCNGHLTTVTHYGTERINEGIGAGYCASRLLNTQLSLESGSN